MGWLGRLANSQPAVQAGLNCRAKEGLQINGVNSLITLAFIAQDQARLAELIKNLGADDFLASWAMPWPEHAKDWQTLANISVQYMIFLPHKAAWPSARQIVDYFSILIDSNRSRQAPFAAGGFGDGSVFARELEHELDKIGSLAFSALIFEANDMAELGAPPNVAALELAHRDLQPDLVLPARQKDDLWRQACRRGAWCRMRLMLWRHMSSREIRHELMLPAQALLWVICLVILLLNILGYDTLLWGMILLLYPLNRDFLRRVVQQVPECLFTGLFYCFWRPWAWLYGMIRNPQS